AIRLVRNELYQDERGNLRPRATDKTYTVPVGLVFRSVGYRGVALPGVPFYDLWGIIPNEKGRVLNTFGSSDVVTGNYVVGWIKRGPSGIIGTNKPDSVETVESLLADIRAGATLNPKDPARSSVDNLLNERGVRVISYADWQRIDEIERERGEAVGRPRLKFCTIEEMLDALEARSATQPSGD
ncbi:MAG: NADP oxidoreductase, partial [Chloroflexota bacterium]